MTIIHTLGCIVLFIDLLKHYDDILPPTIARKKRESERRIPIRKRTAPVDMRMSRGKISVGAPSREILAAQQAAQRVAAQVPDATISERVAEEAPRAAVHASPISESKSFDTEPETSDAAVEEREQFDRTDQSVISPPVVEDDSTPQRPEFKEPPPEFDEPPRPTFKEPPPEVDDVPSMQPTAFVSPPASPPPVMDEKPSPAVSVTPATPHNPIKALRRNSAIRSGNASPARSPSPLASPATPTIPAEDQVLSAGRTGLSRHSSGQAAVVRGPRISRGPRPAGGGSVSSMVANLNRSSMSKSPPPSPNYKRLSGGTTRPVSMLGAADGKSKIGRSGAFSRRTMASDAEDEVVDR